MGVTEAPTTRLTTPGGRSGRELGAAWLRLGSLWTFALALPLFQLFDDSPEYLIARGNGWPDLPVYTLALLALPPTVMVALEGLAARARLGEWLHLCWVALLAAVIAVQILKEQFDPARRSLTVAALVLGGLFAFAYSRGRLVPTVLTVLSPAPLVAAIWFLAFSSAAQFAWPAGTPDAGGARAPRAVPLAVVVFDEL